MKSKNRNVEGLIQQIRELDKRLRGIEGTIRASALITQRRQKLTTLFKSLLPNTSEEIVSQLISIIQRDDVDVGYETTLIEGIIEDHDSKEILVDAAEIMQTLGQEGTRILQRSENNIDKPLSQCEEDIKTIRLAGVSLSELSETWERLLTIQRALFSEKVEISRLRHNYENRYNHISDMLNKTKEKGKKYFERIGQRKGGTLKEGIKPLVDDFLSESQIKELERQSSSLHLRLESALKNVHEVLTYVNTLSSQRIQMNLIVLNILSLIGAIASTISLLEISQQTILQNASIAFILIPITFLITLIIGLILFRKTN